MEDWKDIPKYEGLYEASNKGRIRSKEGKATYTERHGKRIWKSRILKEKSKSDRAPRVSLWKDGKSKSFLVHRLVAKSFLSNPENKPCINHIDGNPQNNYLENLEWCTYEENQNHAFDNELIGTATKVSLINKETGQEKTFRSMAKASKHIEKYEDYIASLLREGKTETDDYIIKKH